MSPKPLKYLYDQTFHRKNCHNMPPKRLNYLYECEPDAPMVLLKRSDFVKCGKLMKYEEVTDLHVPYESLTHDLSKSAIVFVSHRWTSSGTPDIEDHLKYKTISLGMNILQRQIGSEIDMYVWVDYSCMHQEDRVKMGSGIASLPAYVERSAIVLTPLFPDNLYTSKDKEHINGLSETLLMKITANMEPEHRQIIRRDNRLALLDVTSRGWIRVEQYMASNIPFCGKQIGQYDFFQAIGSHRTDRPHFLVMNTLKMVDPLPTLPRLSNETVKLLDPLNGELYAPEDKAKIELVLSKVKHLVDDDVEGSYIGDTDGKGVPHGFGTKVFPNGDEHRGFFIHGKRDGYGKTTYSSGASYEGDWKDDMQDGYGHLSYAFGDGHKGYFKKNNRHGKGIYMYGSGPIFPGEWKNSLCLDGYYLSSDGHKVDSDRGMGTYFSKMAGLEDEEYYGIEGYSAAYASDAAHTDKAKQSFLDSLLKGCMAQIGMRDLQSESML